MPSEKPQTVYESAVQDALESAANRFFIALSSGKLTRAQYDTLKPRDRRTYRRKFGAPKNTEQLYARKVEMQRRKVRRKLANESRKRNLRIKSR